MTEMESGEPITPPGIKTEIACGNRLSEDKKITIKWPRTLSLPYNEQAKIRAGVLTELTAQGLEVGEITRVGPGIRIQVEAVNGDKIKFRYLPPEFDKIPDFMAERRTFCLRGGPDGKTPLIREWQPGSKKAFTSTGWDDHPECLMTLREAFHEYLARKNEFKGIGYLNGKTENQITGIDLDACIDPETGEISSFAIDFLNRIKPFYIETSPSGVGLRAFCLGKLPGDLNKIAGAGSQDLTELTKERILAVKPSLREKKGPKFNCIELYQAHRHLSLTGEYLCEFEAADRTGELAEAIKAIGRPLPTSEKEAYEMHFTKVEDLSGDSCLGYIPATEAYPETWCKISTYGHGFFIEEVGGPKKKDAPSCSQASKRRGYPEIDILQVAKSEGFIITDASGDNVLGYFPQIGSSTGKNIVIDVKKGLYCYMHNGLNVGGDAWTMLARLSGAASWEEDGKGLLNNPKVREATIKYAVEKGYVMPGEVKTSPFGIQYDDISKDNGNGLYVLSVTRAADAILEKMPVVMEEGDPDTIYCFDGELYQPDGEREIDMVLCRLAGDQVTSYSLKEVIRRVKNDLRKRAIKLNPYPWLLGVENGVVDLREGVLIDYDPKFYLTAKIPVKFNPEAKCPQFFSFLNSITPNATSRLTLIDTGATLLIRESMPNILFLLGLGRNGKGVYEHILRCLIGFEKFSGTGIDELSDSRFAAGYLKDKWGLIVTESQRRRGREVLDTQILKKITGKDPIDSDRKNRDRVFFTPYCKIIVDTNIMPYIEDQSRGFEQRLDKVDLPYVFVENPKEDHERLIDPNMYDKTTTPEELEGILCVFVERAKEILKTGTIIRQDPKKAMEEYNSQSSSVNAFLEEFCDYSPSDDIPCSVSNTDIYEAYSKWCDLFVASKVKPKYFREQLIRFCDSRAPERICDFVNKRRLRCQRGLTFLDDYYDKVMKQKQQTLEGEEEEEVKAHKKIWFDLALRYGDKTEEVLKAETARALEQIQKPEQVREEDEEGGHMDEERKWVDGGEEGHILDVEAQDTARREHFEEVAKHFTEVHEEILGSI